MDDRKIVRTRSAGVFFGYVTLAGNVATIRDARRIWYWSGAATLSQLAVDGTSTPNKCKFPVPVSEITVFDVVEVLCVTQHAAASIDMVRIWSA